MLRSYLQKTPKTPNKTLHRYWVVYGYKKNKGASILRRYYLS